MLTGSRRKSDVNRRERTAAHTPCTASNLRINRKQTGLYSSESHSIFEDQVGKVLDTHKIETKREINFPICYAIWAAVGEHQ